MKLHLESVLNCPAEAAWEEVQTPELLAEVIWPMLKFSPRKGESLPARWTEGSVVVGRMSKFGILPIGEHTIHFERVDPQARQIQSHEHSWIVRRWDHLISVQATSDGRTRYADDLEISAGLLTPMVWLFANVFYRHRQRRWRRVAKRLAAA